MVDRRLAGPQQRRLADGVAEDTVEIQQCGFAARIHRVQIRLHHHAAPRVEQPADVIGGRERLIVAVTLGIARTGAHSGLDHDLRRIRVLGKTGLQRRQRLRVHFHETGRHHRNAGGVQIVQIMLVDIPAQDRQRIEQSTDAVDTFAPVQERGQPLDIIPGGTQYYRVVTPPGHGEIVPGADLGAQTQTLARRQQQGHVVIERSGSDGGNKDETGHAASLAGHDDCATGSRADMPQSTVSGRRGQPVDLPVCTDLPTPQECPRMHRTVSA